jgi:chromate transporter
VVDKRHWIGERRFLHALSFCNLLPGPEAQQLATYLGWLMHGVKGGLAAGIIFVVPGAIVMLALSLIYALAGQVPVIDALFFGLKSAVLVLVVEALLRIGRRALKGKVAWTLAGAAFIALFFFHVPFPVVVLISGAIGYFAPTYFSAGGHGEAKNDAPALIDALLEADPERPQRLAASARRAGLIILALWLTPVALLMALVGGTFADVGWFFSKMAVVTIGGAYAVLAYVAQDAVEAYHWLSPSEMLAGLGLAETTPGPLILVLQFVGFLAGYRAPGPLTGVAGGTISSVLTLWATFAPCFVFVFMGAPLIERLQSYTQLTGALAAVTASVVGVVTNLAVWFALQVLFRDHFSLRAGPLAVLLPVPASIDLAALALALVAVVCLFRLKLGVLRTLGITAALELVVRFAITM